MLKAYQDKVKLRILIIDDNRALADLIGYQLIDKVNFELAYSFMEAIACIDSPIKYDYIVLDGLDGDCVQVIAMIKKFQPKSKVIAYSGDMELQDYMVRSGAISCDKDAIDYLLGILHV